jgi:hypothetical protein
MNYPLPLSLGFVGIAVSILVIGGGLVVLFLRTMKQKEVDRRVIFIFVFVAVATPVLFPFTFKEKPSSIVQAVFDKIESLPAGSHVMLSFDFDPAMAPEVQPMADVISRHCLAKGHKVVYIAIWATGQALLTQTVDRVVKQEFPEKQEEIDYVNLGYKAGNEGVMNVIVTNLKKLFPTDVNNRPLDSIPALKGIASCRDLDLIVSMGGGAPGPKEWILFVGDPGNVPVAAGAAAVSAPQLYPYYPKQLLGILGGIKGAAEYEFELIRRYPRFAKIDTPALKMMGPQTLAHVVIMAFIVLGNIAYFRGRKGGKK